MLGTKERASELRLARIPDFPLRLAGDPPSPSMQVNLPESKEKQPPVVFHPGAASGGPRGAENCRKPAVLISFTTRACLGLVLLAPRFPARGRFSLDSGKFTCTEGGGGVPGEPQEEHRKTRKAKAACAPLRPSTARRGGGRGGQNAMQANLPGSKLNLMLPRTPTLEDRWA